MDFKGNYRIEAVYFEKLKRNINEAKRLLESGATEEARFLLEDSVDVDGAVLLLYRNLGELWADLADKLEETKKALQDLDEKTEKYHDELNEKIDEINNYIMSLIRALEERVTTLETTVADHETRIENLETEIVNKITAPISPATGAFLVYDGTEWVAQTLATWEGGNY